MVNNVNNTFGYRDRNRRTPFEHRRYWLNILAYAFLLQWYFRPFCLQYLRKSSLYGSLPSILFNAYAYLALAISMVVLLLWGIRRFEFKDSFLILFFLWIALSGLINRGFYEFASSMANLFTQLGLSCLVIHLLKQRPRTIAWALLIIFAVHFVLNVITVVAFPTGMLHGGTTTSYTYFFGGKNSVFMWGIVLPAAMVFMLYITKESRWTSLAIVVSVVYGLLAIRVDSASSTACFIVTALFLFMESKSLLPKPLFTPPTYLIVLVAVFFIVIVFNAASIFADLLGALNRSTNFSGRDIVWAQAIDYVKSSPLFGCGDDIPFYLSGSDAHHAHSFYLTYAAQYGVPAPVFFLLDAWLICVRVKNANNPYTNLLAIPYCILLFHSLFDVVDLSLVILLRTLIAYETDFYPDEQTNSYTRSSMRAYGLNGYVQSSGKIDSISGDGLIATEESNRG